MKLYQIEHWPITVVQRDLVMASGPRSALAAFKRHWFKKGVGPTRVLSVSEPMLGATSTGKRGVVTGWKVVLDFDKAFYCL